MNTELRTAERARARASETAKSTVNAKVKGECQKAENERSA